MKRSPMPPRKNPMPRGSLCSKAFGADEPKQARPRRSTGKHVGEGKAKRDVRKRSGGDCEIRSPWCLGRATNASHRRHEGQGGLWQAVNILDSCGWGNTTGCHGYLHQHPREARDNGWIVSAWGADPAGVQVLMWHGGRCDWFLLLNEEPWVQLAPWPKGDPRHPDDIEVRVDRGLDGVA